MRLSRFTTWTRSIITASALTFISAPASAQTSWYANLSGAQENPPSGSPGTGFVFLSLSGSMLSISATFSGLTGNTTAAHIHCCAAPPTNAAVATQTPSFIGFPLGVTGGTFANVYDLDLSGSYRAGFINDNGGTTALAKAVLLNGLNTGQAYFNIHTTTSGGGEIRGQLLVTPEPSTVALLTAGLLAVTVAARRRRA